MLQSVLTNKGHGYKNNEHGHGGFCAGSEISIAAEWGGGDDRGGGRGSGWSNHGSGWSGADFGADGNGFGSAYGCLDGDNGNGQ